MANGSVENMVSAEGISRRAFLRNSGLGCAALTAAPACAAPATAPVNVRPGTHRARAVILLWLDGGVSPYETFAPHDSTGTATGLFGAIPTRVEGHCVSGLMPRMADWMDRALFVRAVGHADGTHAGATHQMLTGYAPDASTALPTLGELCAYGLGAPVGSAPQLARTPGVPSHAIAPHLACGDEDQPSLPQVVAAPEPFPTRRDRRRALLTHLAAPPTLPSTRPGLARVNAYGDSEFGRHCLAALDKVEAGSAFVQVTFGGWDRHANLADGYRTLVPQLDAGFSGLLTDLEVRGLLAETLVVCMSEFGRSPRLNALGGRDHWPYAGCALLAGGGIPGGQTVGTVGPDGHPLEGTVSPDELLTSILARVEVPRPAPMRLV